MEGNVDPGEIRKELYREAQASQICQEEEEGLQKEEETAGGLASEFLEEESRRRKEVLETLLQEGRKKRKRSLPGRSRPVSQLSHWLAYCIST